MKQKWKPYVLMLPQVVVTVLFMVGLITGIIQSFGVIPAFGLYQPTLSYYREILGRADVLASISFSLYLAFVSAAVSAVCGVFFCMLLVMARKTKGFILKSIQLPVIVPHVVVAIFVINILSSNGLLARFCYHLGLLEEQQQFLSLIFDEKGVGVILAYLWKEIPFIIYFVLGLMANISEGLGEAAVNLGASQMKSFLKVTLPLCAHTIISGFLIIFVFALGAYELPALLGPTLPKALSVMAYTQYIHPDLQNRPYAMALNGIIILISLAAAVLYYVLMRNNLRILRREQI